MFTVPRVGCALVIAAMILGGGSDARSETGRSISVATAVRWNVYDDRLREAWDPGASLEASLAYRQGIDVVRVGAETVQRRSRRLDVPDFRSVFVFGGWEREQRLGSVWRGFAGVRTGIQMMWFDVEASRIVDPRESELGFGLVGGLARDVGGWSLALDTEYRIVMTDPQLTQVLLGVDVSRTVTAIR